jgi:hypothetical protein
VNDFVKNAVVLGLVTLRRDLLLPFLGTLRFEEVGSSEKSARSYQPTRRHITEDRKALR